MNTKHITFTKRVPTELANLRLDQAVAKLCPDYSRSQWQHWIKQGHVQLDGKICTQIKEKVHPNQHITLKASLTPLEHWSSENIPLSIVYEDNDLIIVNKPAGLVVHPGAGNPSHTLVNALLHHAPDLAAIPRAGILHRLDKETSGLLIIAKTLTAHHKLTQALKARTIHREYLALAKGTLIAGATIQAPIGRHSTHRTKMAVTPTGREAITHYRILEKFKFHTFIQVKLETGRTHQIRVHLDHIHHPLVGDPTYGRHRAIPGRLPEPLKQQLQKFQRQALHAFKLTFTHPTTQKSMSFEAPLPEDLQDLITALRENP